MSLLRAIKVFTVLSLSYTSLLVNASIDSDALAVLPPLSVLPPPLCPSPCVVVYGITTGFGKFAHVNISDEKLMLVQPLYLNWTALYSTPFHLPQRPPGASHPFPFSWRGPSTPSLPSPSPPHTANQRPC